MRVTSVTLQTRLKKAIDDRAGIADYVHMNAMDSKATETLDPWTRPVVPPRVTDAEIEAYAAQSPCSRERTLCDVALGRRGLTNGHTTGSARIEITRRIDDHRRFVARNPPDATPDWTPSVGEWR